MPKYQKDIYCDEEVFGENFPESVKVLSDDEEYIKTFDNGIGAGIVFKTLISILMMKNLKTGIVYMF